MLVYSLSNGHTCITNRKNWDSIYTKSMIFVVYGRMTRYSNNSSSFSNRIKYPVKIRKGGNRPILNGYFLDSTSYIDSHGMLQAHTYQKPCNLFVYITLHSAYPPGLTKCLILVIYKHIATKNLFLQTFSAW